MRVCILAPFLDVYKGGNHLSLLGACHETQFHVLTGRVIPKGTRLPANVTVTILPGRLGTFWYGIADGRYAHAVLRKFPVRSSYWKQFDLIHLNQTLSTAFLSLVETGKPLLYAVHHPVSVDREVAFSESSLFERLRWSARYAFPVRSQRMLCRRMPHVMTVSETVRQRLCGDYHCDTKKIHIVPNGVNGDIFHMVDETQADVCAVGSFLHPRKGFRYLLEAYRQCSDIGLQIADVGRRNKAQVAMLKRIPNMTIHGTVPHEKLVSIVQRSKVLISTSLYEGFGLSLIEALSCGRPVVAFDSGAVPEVLAPIDVRMIVPQRDVPTMVSRVREFIGITKSRREELRAKTLGLYALEKSAMALSEIYTRVQFPTESI